MMTPPSPLPPSSQANGDAAEAGAGGYANEDAAGGTALGVALAAAAAAVNAALRNAPVAPQGLGQGGAAAGGETVHGFGVFRCVFVGGQDEYCSTFHHLLFERQEYKRSYHP